MAAGTGITPAELKRVRIARVNREQASAEWMDAIRAAHAAGISLRVIALEAHISHVRVLQITREA